MIYSKLTLGVVLFMLMMTGCGGKRDKPIMTLAPINPTFTSSPMLTSTHTNTPTTLPTSTTTHTPTLSLLLEGSLLDKDNGMPLEGAMVLLCLKVPDQPVCVIDSTLISKTDSNGQFKITGVATGNYGIIYNISGESRQDLDGTELEYSPVAKSSDPASGNVAHLLQSLGVNEAILCEAYYDIIDGNLVISGYVFVEELDLAVVFYDGDLVYANVENGSGKIDLSVWNTVYDDSCKEGTDNFYPWQD